MLLIPKTVLSISRKLDRVFQGSAEMAKYGSVKQNPYSFQDDVLAPVESVEGLRATNVKMTEVMNLMRICKLSICKLS